MSILPSLPAMPTLTTPLLLSHLSLALCAQPLAWQVSSQWIGRGDNAQINRRLAVSIAWEDNGRGNRRAVRHRDATAAAARHVIHAPQQLLFACPTWGPHSWGMIILRRLARRLAQGTTAGSRHDGWQQAAAATSGIRRC